MIQDDLEECLDRPNGNEFVLNAYQVFHRFESIRQSLKCGNIKGIHKQVGDLWIIDSLKIRKAVAIGNYFVEQSNIVNSDVESESDGSSTLKDLPYQKQSICREPEPEADQRASINVIESKSSVIAMERLHDESNQSPFATAAESNSGSSPKCNLALVDQDESSKDDSAHPTQTNSKIDNPITIPDDAPVQTSHVSSNRFGQGNPPPISGRNSIPPNLEFSTSPKSETSMSMRFCTKWLINSNYKNVRSRMKKVMKLTSRNIREHRRKNRFLPAFKFNANPEENGSIRLEGTLLLEDLMRRLFICIGEKQDSDPKVPIYFDSLYKDICKETILTVSNFLIPLIFDSTSNFEDMADIMYNFLRDVEYHIDVTADTGVKKGLREHIECVRDVLKSFEDIASLVMNSVEFLTEYVRMLNAHVYFAKVCPVNVTSARMLLALRDFLGYVTEDFITLIIGNFEKWKIFQRKNNIILSCLGRV